MHGCGLRSCTVADRGDRRCSRLRHSRVWRAFGESDRSALAVATDGGCGSGLIATNAAIKTILVIAVDMIHRLTGPNDPGCFLWSDGAGPVVLEGGSLQGFIGATFQADGTTHLVGAF
jgi:3-Oxoacyl-[acyl-carrier-protein (ACP)] synthase III